MLRLAHVEPAVEPADGGRRARPAGDAPSRDASARMPSPPNSQWASHRIMKPCAEPPVRRPSAIETGENAPDCGSAKSGDSALRPGIPEQQPAGARVVGDEDLVRRVQIARVPDRYGAADQRAVFDRHEERTEARARRSTTARRRSDRAPRPLRCAAASRGAPPFTASESRDLRGAGGSRRAARSGGRS